MYSAKGPEVSKVDTSGRVSRGSVTGPPTEGQCYQHHDQHRQPHGLDRLQERETPNIHPSQDMGKDAGRGTDDALKHVCVFVRGFQQAPEHWQYLEAHDLLVLIREGRSRECLGDEVSSPAPQLECGVGGGKGQDAVHDRLVVGRVDEYGLAGFIQLLELLAHGLHSVGGHDGQLGWHYGQRFSGMGRGKKAHKVGGPQSASTLRSGRGTEGFPASQRSKRWSRGQARKSQLVIQLEFVRVRVSESECNRREAQSVVALRRWLLTMSRSDAMRYGAMLILTRTAAAHYLDEFQRDRCAVAESRNGLTVRSEARIRACSRRNLRREPMKACPRSARLNGVVDWVDEWSEAACEFAV